MRQYTPLFYEDVIPNLCPNLNAGLANLSWQRRQLVWCSKDAWLNKIPWGMPSMIIATITPHVRIRVTSQERHCVSNHRRLDWLLFNLFRSATATKNYALVALCEGNPPVTHPPVKRRYFLAMTSSYLLMVSLSQLWDCCCWIGFAVYL